MNILDKFIILNHYYSYDIYNAYNYFICKYNLPILNLRLCI